MGVMLAMSAIFAVVISTISMPGDRAFGQTTSMTNSAKIQSALDALEDALLDPEFDAAAADPDPGGKITQLQAAVAAIPANIAPDTDNNDTADETDGTPDPLFAIEVDNPAAAEDGTGETGAKISISSALTDGGGSAETNGLTEYLSALSGARGPASTSTTEAGALAAADAAFTALKAVTHDHDGDGGTTPAVALTDATQSALDGLNERLFRGTADFTDAEGAADPMKMADFRTSVEDALKADMNWYPNEFTGTSTIPTAATTQLDALFAANTADDVTDDAGAVHDLTDARIAESEALAGAKAILEAVKTAVDAATLPAVDMAIYTPVSPRTTEAAEKEEADKQLASAKMLLAELVGRLNANNAEEFTALDEQYALKTALTGVGVPSSGVTMTRLDAAETALLKNNLAALGVTADTDDDGRPEIGDGEIMNLRDDSLTHIIDALMKLSDLDGTDAQKAAIAALDDVLTKVDAAVMATAATDDNAAALTMKDADRLKAALDALDALKVALDNKHVDTDLPGPDDDTPLNANSVADHRAALNMLADGDVSGTLETAVETAADALTTALAEDGDSGTDGHQPSVTFTAFDESGLLAAAIADNPGVATVDPDTGEGVVVTTAELGAALMLTRTQTAGADTADDTNDDTYAMSTDDFHATLVAMVALLGVDTVVDVADTPATIGVQPQAALVTLGTALQTPLDAAVDATPAGKLATANAAAEAYRSSTLAYNDFAAMAALQDALNDLEAPGGDRDEEVRIAREALIDAHGNQDGLTADAQSEVSTAYTELISKGSTQHAFAQKAALLELKSALETAGDDSEALETAIRSALTTQSPQEQQAQAMISRIEPAIRGATVSGGDEITLEVEIYGLQNVKDQKLADGVTFDWGDASSGEGPSITYTAPSSPGMHTVTASLDSNECYHEDSDDQMEKCSASFEIRVRRPSAEQEPDPAPVNPPGDIPELLADDGGNQYAVFTPEEGGSFSGEGYSITAAAGAVPNNEFIGIRMSDDGAASNAGMTHQRYTLGGNMYGVHAVDSSSQAVSSYVLDDPATVCVPLPAELSQNISELAVVALNSDDSLTILSAQVRISDAGTMVCGGLSNLPASVAVGSAGAPAAIPTPTPEPTPEAPDTGGTAPASSTMVLWALLLGIATLALGSVLVIGRRRESVSKS